MGEYTIDIDGHAGFNPGMDIVCSACSILGYTLLNALESQHAEYKIMSEDEGNIHIVFKPMEHDAEYTDAIITTVMTGYELLAEQYPNNVELNY